MKIKTNELIGLPLEWAVAVCEGHDVVVLTPEEHRARWFEYVSPDKLEKEKADYDHYIAPVVKPVICVRGDDGFKRWPTHREVAMLWGEGIPVFQYSKSYAQAGPIIGREKISVVKQDPPADNWWAFCAQQAPGDGYGPTPLIAAMRCYVASKLGAEIDVPEELV